MNGVRLFADTQKSDPLKKLIAAVVLQALRDLKGRDFWMQLDALEFLTSDECRDFLDYLGLPDEPALLMRNSLETNLQQRR